MLAKVAVHGVGPGIRAEAGSGIQLTQLVVVLERGQLYSPKQFIAHEDAERANISGEAMRRRRQNQVGFGGMRCDVWVNKLLPLVEQARVDLTHQFAEPFDQIEQILGFGLGWNGLPGRPVRVGEVAQHDALAASELVEGHELAERHGSLVHVAHDRFWAELEVGDPGLR